MAGYKELLEKLQAGEVENIAGEILRELDGESKERAQNAAFAPGKEEWEARLQRTQTRDIVQALRELVMQESRSDGSEDTGSLGSRPSDRTESAEHTEKGPDWLSMQSVPEEGTQGSGGIKTIYGGGGRNISDAEKLSEYIRRDSRRYDCGFERY